MVDKKEVKSDFSSKFQEVGAIWSGKNGSLSINMKEDVKKDERLVAFSNKKATIENKQPSHRLFRSLEPSK